MVSQLFVLHFSSDTIFHSPGTFTGNVGTLHATSLRVFDLLGREVVVLIDEKKEPGKYAVPFSRSGLASGVYVYRLTVGERNLSRTMLLLK